MKSQIVILILFFPFVTLGQDTVKSNVDTIFVGLTAYPYYYNVKLSNGNVAIGPSFFLNSNKLTLQVSFMEDVKSYNTYVYNHFGSPTIVKNVNYFFSVLFHYRYLSSVKFGCFATAGTVIGGRYFHDENNITRKTIGINFIAGTGLSYKIHKYLVGRLSFTMRYSQEIFFPGLLFDLAIPIKVKQSKE